MQLKPKRLWPGHMCSHQMEATHMGGTWPSWTGASNPEQQDREAAKRSQPNTWGRNEEQKALKRRERKAGWQQLPLPAPHTPGDNVEVPGPSTTVGLCTGQGVWDIPGQGCLAFPVGRLAVFRPRIPARATFPGSEPRSFGGSKIPGQLVPPPQSRWLQPYREHVALLASEGWASPVHPAEGRSPRSGEGCTSRSDPCLAGS